MSKQYCYGLTGGIGSGKSYVAQIFSSEYYLPVYDSDQAAKQLILSSVTLQQKLKKIIGETVVDEKSGALNKKVIADFLFENVFHAQQINKVVHPAVKKDFLEWSARQTTDVILESAILFESGFSQFVDKSIVVVAPTELRIQRVMSRDGIGAEAVLQRMVLQMKDSELMNLADAVIYNDGQQLLPQIKNVLNNS